MCHFWLQTTSGSPQRYSLHQWLYNIYAINLLPALKIHGHTRVSTLFSFYSRSTYSNGLPITKKWDRRMKVGTLTNRKKILILDKYQSNKTEIAGLLYSFKACGAGLLAEATLQSSTLDWALYKNVWVLALRITENMQQGNYLKQPRDCSRSSSFSGLIQSGFAESVWFLKAKSTSEILH